MAQQQGLILLQPYLTLEAQHCQRIPQVGTGIAECYEFTIPANSQPYPMAALIWSLAWGNKMFGCLLAEQFYR